MGTEGIEGVHLALQLAENDLLAARERITDIDGTGRPFFEGGPPFHEDALPGKESQELLEHGDMVTP